MKRTFKFIIILVIIISLLGIENKVEASSVSFTSNKSEVKVGDTITVTATVTAAQWDLKITLDGKTLASSSELDNYESNITKTITATYQATAEGSLTFLLQGDATDVSQKVDKINKSITVNVKKVETPAPDQTPKPEKPTVEETPDFTNANKTMYTSKDINLRASWSTSSKATKVNQGTELAVTGTSNNKVNGYTWYRVSYNGKTLYVASNLLTDTKPEETDKTEQEEPEDEIPVEDQTTENSNSTILKHGLKSLEIEGLTLSPEFSPNVYEYRAIVKEDISELAINAETVTDGSTITIAKNQNLAEGENLITIVVYNVENEVEATYQITIYKSTLDLSKTDKMLEQGTKEAKREFIIYITIFVISFVGLIIVIILRKKNENYEEEYEEIYQEDKEFTNSKEAVKNPDNQIAQGKTVQEETSKLRSEKRKGKHF